MAPWHCSLTDQSALAHVLQGRAAGGDWGPRRLGLLARALLYDFRTLHASLNLPPAGTEDALSLRARAGLGRIKHPPERFLLQENALESLILTLDVGTTARGRLIL